MDMEKIKNIIKFNFGADAFALGYQWTYDSKLNLENILQSKFEFIDPLATRFHNRKAGEFSPYGDQNFSLLKFMTDNEKFSSEAYKKYWLKIWIPDYDDWIDSATKTTLETDSGSFSSDLSPVGRISPLFLESDLNLSVLQKNIKEYISITHNNQEVLDFGSFIGELVFKIDEKNGKIDEDELIDFVRNIKASYSRCEKHIDLGIKMTAYTPEELIENQFPTDCEIEASGPLTVYLLLKFWNNYEEMFKWNMILDGDTCARAGVLSAVVGGYGIYPDFAKRWYNSLKRKNEIEFLLGS